MLTTYPDCKTKYVGKLIVVHVRRHGEAVFNTEAKAQRYIDMTSQDKRLKVTRREREAADAA